MEEKSKMVVVRRRLNADGKDRTAAIEYRPIGWIETPFVRADGTPIQSCYADGAEGVVVVAEEYAAGLKDIEAFDRLWLVYAIDRACAPQLTVTPYLSDEAHGIFATRSPARPNAIGISPVRLLAVEGNRIRVAGVDMLDGTPLLDIKPYVPAFDVLPAERIGWLEGRLREGVTADGRFERDGD